MLKSPRLLFRALQSSDLNGTYLDWLNDSAVNRYLETRFLPQTSESLQSYWQAHRDDLLGDVREVEVEAVLLDPLLLLRNEVLPRGGGGVNRAQLALRSARGARRQAAATPRLESGVPMG